jgi:predicted nucleic acid-binding protein
MKAVEDASIIIFLAKAKYLSLLPDLFKGPIYITDRVNDELLASDPPSFETTSLKKQFESLFKVISYKPFTKAQGALSQADWSVIQAAEQMDVDIVLSDDKALRNVAVGLGYQIMGTLGILARAAQMKIIRKEEAIRIVDELVSHHRFHISADAYQLFLKFLEHPPPSK